MRNMEGRSRCALGAAVLAALALSGCGNDGVELNGTIFDYLGVSSAAQSQRNAEPKLASRTGIVLPPQLDRLPEPGSGESAEGASQAWPDDPDARKAAAASESDRQHAAFCRDALWKARAQGQQDVQINGPKGPCSPSVLRNWTGKDITTR